MKQYPNFNFRVGDCNLNNIAKERYFDTRIDANSSLPLEFNYMVNCLYNECLMSITDDETH